ncbi:MAG: glycosyltransferase family 39 protein [Phycisphaerales bacterium]|nr:glycosyltransferase family 39 protein [Phycisphaerales bacterium]
MSRSPASAETPAVSVIIPTLNEAGNIDLLLERLFHAAHAADLDVEAVVVDDASTDGTADLVRRWSTTHPVQLLERHNERGLAGAVIAGARLALANVVVVMDADLSHPPEKLAELAGPVLARTVDMTVGSRYIPGGATPGWAWTRRLVSRTASLLAWPLVDVADPMSGFFAVRREHLLHVDPHVPGFKIGLEVMCGTTDSLRVSEVPIVFHERHAGKSKLDHRQVIAYLRRLGALAGSDLPGPDSWWIALTAMLALLVDLDAFAVLKLSGMSLTNAHLLSFLTAVITLGILNRRRLALTRDRRRAGPTLERTGRLLVIGLLAATLRGAVLSQVIAAQTPLPVAILIASLVSCAILLLGCVSFVFRPVSPAGSLATHWRAAAVIIVSYLVILRLVYLGGPDLLMEEAYYWNYAQHPSLSYLDHPPMVAWLIWLGTHIFGNTEFGIRIGAFACWGIAAFFTYLMARDAYGKSVAIRTVMLLACLPFFMAVGFFMTPDAPLTACWAGALYFFQRALIDGRRRAWLGTAVCIGLGFLSKYTILLLAPAMLIFMLLDPRARRWFRRPEPWAAGVLALALALPVVIWNAQNNWASFAFQSVRRMEESWSFGLPELLGSVLVLIGPAAVLGTILVLRPVADRTPDDTVSPDGPGRAARLLLLARLATLIPLAVFIAFSLTHQPKLNWTGPLWIAALPLIARTISPTDGAPGGRVMQFTRRLWMPTLTAFMVGYGLFLHGITLGHFGVLPHVLDPLVGQSDFGRQVEALENQLESQLGEEPLVVGLDKYRIASQLAFYRSYPLEGGTESERWQESITQTTGRHLFGGSALMYEAWSDADAQAGRSMILVGDDAHDLRRRWVIEHFDDLGPILPLTSRRSTLRLYYRIAHGYRTTRTPSPVEAAADAG